MEGFIYGQYPRYLADTGIHIASINRRYSARKGHYMNPLYKRLCTYILIMKGWQMTLRLLAEMGLIDGSKNFIIRDVGFKLIAFGRLYFEVFRSAYFLFYVAE